MENQNAMGILREYGAARARVERALEQLQEDDQRILELLLIVPKQGNLERLCGELGVEKSTVYRRRDKALRRFGGAYAALEPGSAPGRRIREEKVQ